MEVARPGGFWVEGGHRLEFKLRIKEWRADSCVSGFFFFLFFFYLIRVA